MMIQILINCEERVDQFLNFVDDLGINLGPSGNDFGITFESFSDHFVIDLLTESRSIQDPPGKV